LVYAVTSIFNGLHLPEQLLKWRKCMLHEKTIWKSASRVLVGKPEGKKEHRRRLKDNIKTDHSMEDMDWIRTARNRGQWGGGLL
jgi:hypothetical protein